MRARHAAEFLRPGGAGEKDEILHRVFVGAARVTVGDVGEPLDLGRYVSGLLELGSGQQPGYTGGRDLGWQRVGGVGYG